MGSVPDYFYQPPDSTATHTGFVAVKNPTWDDPSKITYLPNVTVTGRTVRRAREITLGNLRLTPGVVSVIALNRPNDTALFDALAKEFGARNGFHFLDRVIRVLAFLGDE